MPEVPAQTRNQPSTQITMLAAIAAIKSIKSLSRLAAAAGKMMSTATGAIADTHSTVQHR